MAREATISAIAAANFTSILATMVFLHDND